MAINKNVFTPVFLAAMSFTNAMFTKVPMNKGWV